MTCSGFYEFHLLHALPGSPLSLYQRACSAVVLRPSYPHAQAILPLADDDDNYIIIIHSLTELSPS
jgi:hypothetical protein